MNRIVSAVFCVLSVLVGCSSLEQPDIVEDSQSKIRQALLKEEQSRFSSSETLVPLSSLAQYNFMRGELALSDEDYDDALRYFEEAAKFEADPAPFLRKRLALLYLRSGHLEQALSETDKGLKGDNNDIDLLKLRAGILVNKGKFDEAVAIYHRLIEIVSQKDLPAREITEVDDIYVLLASLFAKKSDIVSAKAALQELILKRPNSFVGYYYLARVNEEEGNLGEAERLYKKTINLGGETAAVQLDYARVLGLQGNFSEAIHVCDIILNNEPTNIQAHQLKAQLLLGNNKLEDALKEFEQAGSLEKDPTETRFKIALIKIERKDFDGAIIELSLVIANKPEFFTARYYLALALANQKRVEEALAELYKIPPSEKIFIQSRTYAAYLLRLEGRYKEAISNLDQALSIEPKNIKLLLLLGSMKHESKDLLGAIEQLKKIIEIEPDNDANYFNLGVLYDEAGNKKSANEAIHQAIKINPKNANALNYLGYSLTEEGKDLEEALELINRAIKLEPNNGYYLDSLGWIYFKMGKFADAVDNLEQAVKLTKNDAVILEHLALAYVKVSNLQKALQVLHKAAQVAPESDDKEVGGRIQKLIADLEAKITSGTNK